MSNASSTIVKLAAESTFGTQASAPYYNLNFTSTSLRPTTTYQQDPSIRGTRDIPDLVRLGLGAEGDLGFALRYDDSGALYQLIAAVMQDGSIDGEQTHTGATASIDSVVDTQLAVAGIQTGLEVGDVVRVSTSGGALVGFFEVKSIGTGSIIVYGGSGLSLATNLEVKRGARLKNAAVQKSFTVEVGHPDMSGTDKYELYTGMVPDRMRLTIADGQMTQGSFSFVGKRLAATNTATVDSGSTAAPTTQVMNCVDHVPAFRITSTNYEATEISFEINNASAARTVIGTLGSKSVRSGSFQVTGTIRAYLDDYTEFEKVVNDTESSLLVACRDAAGKAYAFCFPRIKYSQVEAPTTGQDTDVFVTLQWQAVYDSGSQCTMRTLFWA